MAIVRVMCWASALTLLPALLAFPRARWRHPSARVVEIVALSVILALVRTGLLSHVTGEGHRVLALPVFAYVLARLAFASFNDGDREPHLLPLVGLSLFCVFSTTEPPWHLGLSSAFSVATLALVATRSRLMAVAGLLAPIVELGALLVHG